MLKHQEFPHISKELIEALETQFPIMLSKRDDTDWDRGVAYGRQDVINLLKQLKTKQ